MNRRRALGTILGAAASMPAQAARKSNIVFILVDDLRWNALGYAGHPFVKTPNIDRVAREGAIFKNNFVTTPLCSPSRASFLTGQYVRSHTVKGNGDNAELSHKLITFQKLLRDAGYETAHVGKWHMGNDDTPRPGIDRWVSFRGQGQYNDPPLNVDGQRITREGYITDLLTDYSVEFIKKPRTKPFCLYLAHKAIHGPFTPAARHANLFTGQTIARTANAKDSLEGKPMLQRELPLTPAKKANKKKGPEGGGGGSSDELILNQLRCLTSIDEGVGRIWKALEEIKALDNTLFIFTSDNGYFWSEHGLGDKRAAYEESIRIPMAARYPRLIKAGGSIDEMTLNIDIAPTFLELAGAPIPKTVAGKSMLSLMGGNKKGWRTSFLCEYYMEQQQARVATWEAVRTARWKYIHYPELKNMDELYDLKADAGEMKNLVANPGARKALDTMRKELDKYRKEIPA
ncbi:MAG: sulfatase [Candidatus Solibacter usitatus]|nr:sulfatase [Candidatus Solibacter usitatus]